MFAQGFNQSGGTCGRIWWIDSQCGLSFLPLLDNVAEVEFLGNVNDARVQVPEGKIRGHRQCPDAFDSIRNRCLQTTGNAREERLDYHRHCERADPYRTAFLQT